MAIILVFVVTRCSSKVSEPKWASLQTTSCERTYWYSGSHCRYDTTRV